MNNELRQRILTESVRIAKNEIVKKLNEAEGFDDMDDMGDMDDIEGAEIPDDAEVVEDASSELLEWAEEAAAEVFGEDCIVEDEGGDVLVSLDPSKYYSVMESTYDDGKACYVGLCAPMITVASVGKGAVYSAISNLTFEDYVIIDADTLEYVGNKSTDEADDILDVEFEGLELFLIEDEDNVPDSCGVSDYETLLNSFKDFNDVMCADECVLLSQINYEDDIVQSDLSELDAEVCDAIASAIEENLNTEDFEGGSTEAPAEEDFEDDAPVDESVSSRFARYRRLYEAEDVSEEGEEEENDGKGKEKTEDTDKDNGEEETENEDLSAIVIAVGKDDAEKCKDEMVEAGIPEEDIEILDAEDDADRVEIKIDANSAYELKDYLEGKGIDLEEKLGGELFSDDEEEGGEDNGEEEGGEDADNFDINPEEMGDLFADAECE